MDYAYRGYVIKVVSREARVHQHGVFECLARFTSVDEAMRWIDHCVADDERFDDE